MYRIYQRELIRAPKTYRHEHSNKDLLNTLRQLSPGMRVNTVYIETPSKIHPRMSVCSVFMLFAAVIVVGAFVLLLCLLLLSVCLLLLYNFVVVVFCCCCFLLLLFVCLFVFVVVLLVWFG